MSAGSLPLVLDFLGVFAFALNGALTAIGTARLDIVGIITLAMITALGGGIVRDILLARAACHVPGLALPGGGDGRRLVCVRVQSAAGESGPADSGSRRSGFEPVRCHRCSDRGGPGSGALAKPLSSALSPVPGWNDPRYDAGPGTVHATQRILCDTRPTHGDDHRRRDRFRYPRNSLCAGCGRSCFALRMLGVHYNWHVGMHSKPPQTKTPPTGYLNRPESCENSAFEIEDGIMRRIATSAPRATTVITDWFGLRKQHDQAEHTIRPHIASRRARDSPRGGCAGAARDRIGCGGRKPSANWSVAASLTAPAALT